MLLDALYRVKRTEAQLTTLRARDCTDPLERKRLEALAAIQSHEAARLAAARSARNIPMETPQRTAGPRRVRAPFSSNFIDCRCAAVERDDCICIRAYQQGVADANQRLDAQGAIWKAARELVARGSVGTMVEAVKDAREAYRLLTSEQPQQDAKNERGQQWGVRCATGMDFQHGRACVMRVYPAGSLLICHASSLMADESAAIPGACGAR
jgi:hypothetical protein